VSATQYLAFGDSITEGKTSVCPSVTLSDIGSLEADIFRARPRFETGPSAYPRVLEDLLRTRYALQTVNVVNEGFGGSRVTDELGGASLAEFQRFQDAVRASPRPQVVLLQEGTNDITLHAEIPDIIKGLRDMVRDARFRNVQPFVGALLPRVTGTCRGGQADVIPVVNEQIHAMADAEGAFYVDLYNEFGPSFAQYIGQDGLHPNDAGYRKIADVFMAAIQAHLELR
jgi:lysophospholipase L1-like esterase